MSDMEARIARLGFALVSGLAALALMGSATTQGLAASPPGHRHRPARPVLDPSFADGGVLRMPFGSASTTLGTTTSSGDILLGGESAIHILNDHGRPGAAFGRVGSLRLPPARGDRFQLSALTVDSKGRLLVLGTSLFPETENPSPVLENGGRAFRPGVVRILRFLPNGRLDPSFGEGGVVETDLGLSPPEGTEGQPLGTHPAIQATGVAVDRQGRIVVTGGVTDRLGESCEHDSFAPVGVGAGFVARFTANGTADPEFGTDGLFGGRALSENPLGGETISEPTIGPGGVVTYRSTSVDPCEPRQSRLGIAQLTPGGRTRTVFGKSGAMAGPYVAVAEGQGGSIVALSEPGRLGRSAFKAEVTRIAPDGDPDPSFGDAGGTTLTLGPSLFTALNSLAVDREGNILVGGTLVSGKEPAAVLLKLSARGKRDKSFGPHGRVATKIPGLPELGPSSLFFDSGGRLLTLHLHSKRGHTGLVIARYRLNDRK
jgi:uncharacterized delta-60 repeat protein